MHQEYETGMICRRHGGVVKQKHCSHYTHRPKDTAPATSTGKAEGSVQIIKECKAVAAECTTDARGGKIDDSNREANDGHVAAATSGLPSIPQSAIVPNFPEDDNIGASVPPPTAEEHEAGTVDSIDNPLRPSSTDLDFSYEEEIGALIWNFSRIARLRRMVNDIKGSVSLT